MLSNPMVAEGYLSHNPSKKEPPGNDGHHGEILKRVTLKVGRSTGACLSATQALLNGADEDPELRSELLAGIEERLLDIELVVENLAQWRAFELNTFTKRLVPLNLHHWLPQALARWHRAAALKNIVWRTKFSSVLPEVVADPNHLGHVLNNLLVNAIDYTPTGNEVAVEAGTLGSEVWLRIMNAGPGLDADELSRVFEPFFSSRRQGRFPQGIGLGLSVALRLMEAQGGRLTAESELGRGTSFTMWLPVLRLPH